jgi:hypothetical protein
MHDDSNFKYKEEGEDCQSGDKGQNGAKIMSMSSMDCFKMISEFIRPGFQCLRGSNSIETPHRPIGPSTGLQLCHRFPVWYRHDCLRLTKRLILTVHFMTDQISRRPFGRSELMGRPIGWSFPWISPEGRKVEEAVGSQSLKLFHLTLSFLIEIGCSLPDLIRMEMEEPVFLRIFNSWELSCQENEIGWESQSLKFYRLRDFLR